jgi:hypothetical protein
MQTSFVDFVKCARTWTARRIYLRAVLMSRGVRDAERSRSRPECIKHLKQVQCLGGAGEKCESLQPAMDASVLYMATPTPSHTHTQRDTVGDTV